MNRYDLIILGCLKTHALSGYEIKQFAEKHDLQRWANISQSTLYHRLNWLSKNAFIQGSKEQSGNRPVRTRYTITPAGVDLLEQQTQEFLTGFNDDPRTLGLSFIHCLPPEKAIATLTQQLEQLATQQQHLEQTIQQKSPSNLHSQAPLLNAMSLAHIKVEAEYLRQALNIISNADLSPQLNHFFALNR